MSHRLRSLGILATEHTLFLALTCFMMQVYNSLVLTLFSGKGGVGKTTLSCLFARHWAQQFPDETILLISTDPAHSLGDVLQMEVEDCPHTLPELPNLQVRALNAERLLQVFRSTYGAVLELLVERGSFVEGEDLSPVWDLGFPGLDELMSVLEIQRILRQHEADRIVVDMAPSGHTLNLFRLMDFLDNFIASLELFQKKHHVIQQSLTGRYIPDEADDFLLTMKTDLEFGRQLLQDSARSACLAVAIPEPMSYLETQRFLEALRSLHIPFGGLFVNRWPDQVSEEQQTILNQFLTLADSFPVVTIPLQAQEPIGITALDALYPQVLQAERGRSNFFSQNRAMLLLPTSPGFTDFISEGRKLILVGGKGGVGKTTVAAAIAWGMAEHHPDCNIRVISIDPAHSLGDAFGTQIGHYLVSLSRNLTAQEIDSHQVLEEFREEYLWELAEMMSGDTQDDTLKIAYGPQAWRQIVAQALPGIDEMLSLITVMNLLEQQEQDLIILDTAPTGHLLRFLEMPTALTDWLSWIFKLWIKYQDVVGRTDLIGRLRTLRQKVVQAQKKLKDPAHTEFISVMQAQAAVIAETERLTQALTEKRIHQRYLVQNRYTAEQMPLGDRFPQTLVQLPELSGAVTPLAQIQMAAQFLFEPSYQASHSGDEHCAVPTL